MNAALVHECRLMGGKLAVWRTWLSLPEIANSGRSGKSNTTVQLGSFGRNFCGSLANESASVFGVFWKITSVKENGFARPCILVECRPWSAPSLTAPATAAQCVASSSELVRWKSRAAPGARIARSACPRRVVMSWLDCEAPTIAPYSRGQQKCLCCG